MFTLTKEQKISNLEEILVAKKAKRDRLSEEIINLEAKLTKLRNTPERRPSELLSAVTDPFKY